jgi:hypothetical protein
MKVFLMRMEDIWRFWDWVLSKEVIRRDECTSKKTEDGLEEVVGLLGC